MKVLFISRRFYPEIIGGGQISALHIATAVKRQKNEVTVCTFTDKKRKKIEMLNGMKIYRLPIPNIKLFPRLSNMDYMYLQIAKLSTPIIKNEKPDIIHLLNFESIPFSAVYFKNRFKIPIVATVNSPLFGCFTQSGIDYKGHTCIKCRVFKRYLCSVSTWGKVKGSAYYLYSNWYMNILRISYKFVDKFCVVSKAMSPLIENMGVPKSKISVVHNPIGKRLKPDKNKLKRLRKKYKGKKVLFCAGRLAENKGVQYVINSIKYLPENYVLLVAGWGDYENFLKVLVKKNKLGKKVRFLGKVTHNEMGTYYKFADLFLHFPTCYESFGRTLIEANSMGTPVLAYPIAGIKDIIVENKNGFLLKSRNAEKIAEKILEITRKDKLKIKKVVLEKYKEKYVAEKYINEYNDLRKIRRKKN